MIGLITLLIALTYAEDVECTVADNINAHCNLCAQSTEATPTEYCKTCIDGYYSVVVDPAVTEKPGAVTCSECPSKCGTCSIKSGEQPTCDSCATGYEDTTTGTNLCDKCADGFYDSDASEGVTCTSCGITGCKTCTAPAAGTTVATCTACTAETQEVVDNACVDRCATSEYRDNSGVCTACPSNCGTCSIKEEQTVPTCDSCATGYAGDDCATEVCAAGVRGCATCNGNTECTACSDSVNNKPSGVGCVAKVCTDLITNCATCDNTIPTKCTQCANNFFPTKDGQTITKCSACDQTKEYHDSTNECKTCGENQKATNEHTGCECVEGKYKDLDETTLTCLDDCKQGQTKNTDEMTCKTPAATNDCKTGSTAIAHCTECDATTATKCKTCESDFKLNTDGTQCVAKNCTDLITNCATCNSTDSKKCSTCADGYEEVKENDTIKECKKIEDGSIRNMIILAIICVAILL